ncbi:GNAT family N-acetyltransferase [Paenibacillus sp. strain BS8-2]
MLIREAEENEREWIRKQRIEAYRVHANRIPAGHWAALEQAISTDADALEEVKLLVAVEDNGEIAGSVALFHPDIDAYDGLTEKQNIPEIRLLAVSPANRGRGIASALLEECFRRARSEGFAAIGLHTGEFMLEAISLYERTGFIRVPEHDFQPADDGINVRAYRLSLG